MEKVKPAKKRKASVTGRKVGPSVLIRLYYEEVSDLVFPLGEVPSPTRAEVEIDLGYGALQIECDPKKVRFTPKEGGAT